jgi:hypothetical protein
MITSTITLPTKWEKFLKQLAEDHQVEVNSIISEMCEWAFSNSEGKKQFESWLDNAYPPKGEAEDKERNANEQISEDEEETEEESEEEAHEDRNYSEDKEPTPQ